MVSPSVPARVASRLARLLARSNWQGRVFYDSSVSSLSASSATAETVSMDDQPLRSVLASLRPCDSNFGTIIRTDDFGAGRPASLSNLQCRCRDETRVRKSGKPISVFRCSLGRVQLAETCTSNDSRNLLRRIINPSSGRGFSSSVRRYQSSDKPGRTSKNCQQIRQRLTVLPLLTLESFESSVEGVKALIKCQLSVL